MAQLLTVLRERLRFFLVLCAIIIAYLYSYHVGYRSSLQTFAFLITVASLPWLFRSVPDRAASRNGETQPPGLWLPPWDAQTQLRVNEFLAFFAVVTFGVFLRFWRWDFVPHGAFDRRNSLYRQRTSHSRWSADSLLGGNAPNSRESGGALESPNPISTITTLL